MVDEFVYMDDENNHTLFLVREDNILVENGHLSASGLVENIAQTAAARMGYLCRRKGNPPPVGYIGMVQHLQIIALPKVNDEIKTVITVNNQVFNATLITGKILLRETLLAQCDMKIFISNHQ